MTLPPHVLAQCQRILDGAAQRILDEQIEAEAAEADRKARDTPGMAGWWYVRDAQQMRKNEPDVWIYAIQAGDNGGAVKIGLARSPEDRRRALQTGNDLSLTIVAAWRGWAAEERKLHEAFSKFHLRGEWFKGDPILLRFVADMDEKENWA